MVEQDVMQQSGISTVHLLYISLFGKPKDIIEDVKIRPRTPIPRKTVVRFKTSEAKSSKLNDVRMIDVSDQDTRLD